MWSHRNAAQSSLINSYLAYCTARRHLPSDFHLVASCTDDLIKETRDRAAVIRNDAHAFPNLWFVRARGKIDVTVFFGQRIDPGIRVFADISVPIQAE